MMKGKKKNIQDNYIKEGENRTLDSIVTKSCYSTNMLNYIFLLIKCSNVLIG